MEWTKLLIVLSYLLQPGPQPDCQLHFPVPGFVQLSGLRLFVFGFARPLLLAGAIPKTILIKRLPFHFGLVRRWTHYFHCLFGRLCRRIRTGQWFGSVRTAGTCPDNWDGTELLRGTKPNYCHGGGHPWPMHTLICSGSALQRPISFRIYHGLGHNQQTFLTGCSGAGPKLRIFHRLFPGADPARRIFCRFSPGIDLGRLILSRAQGMNAGSAISARSKLLTLLNCAGWPAGGRS